ncbi:hypothetical protein [Streptomyces sp. H34-S4]|uniref:hypothetical protein n=1 Tax=Streptomyces sp. H34-S4 TaxID=2996463 RepID=UPI00227145B3|nr:hypothetical protein [Streptomyces sp. H34-S4]MCY0933657.1 hypothetical protein [Streptomyces sp. H34-S4]
MPSIDEIKKYVTDEIVQDIIDTARHGGITFWATEPTDEELDSLPKGKAWTIVEGGDDRLFGGEREVDGVHYLNAEDIRGAYAKVLDLDQKYVNRKYHGYVLQSWIDRDEKHGIDAGIIDAGTADLLVQVAIFGKVRHG